MKKTIILINILACLFAAYTLMQIASGKAQTTISLETVEMHKAYVQSAQSLEELREFSTASVSLNETLSSLLGKGLSLFQKSVIVFLIVALVNIVVVFLPEKKVKQTVQIDD